MKRWKKIALVVVALLLVSQVPFACRRYRIGRLHARIAEMSERRAPLPSDDPFDEHTGVFHVHSLLGGHSAGTFDEIVRGAKSNGLAFVVMTEHPSPHVNTAEATLRGVHEGVLFVNGSELVASGGERVFVLPGFDSGAPQANTLAARELLALAEREGRMTVLGYPESTSAKELSAYRAVEAYNLYTNSKSINYALLFFDGLWSYWSYPELLFATFYARPDANLRKWDEANALAGSRTYALAGNDAHSNVGFGLCDRTGSCSLGVRLDPYERSFRVVRNHILLPKGEPLTTESLASALAEGRSFIAFDLFGDARGFRFTADNGRERRTLGETITKEGAGSVRLTARSPIPARFTFFRDGQVIYESKGETQAEAQADRAGVYRVEVYLDELGAFLEGKPWIISNPIFVR